MSTRNKRARCAACRTLLPEHAKTTACENCKGQGVLFPKKTAQRLARRRSGTAGGGR